MNILSSIDGFGSEIVTVEHNCSVAQIDLFIDNFYLLAFCIVENVRYKFTSRSDFYVNVEDEILLCVHAVVKNKL